MGGTLSPLALANKAESVVSVTSQCSFSSTIVHVGDKKPPESGMGMERGGSARAPLGPPASWSSRTPAFSLLLWPSSYLGAATSCSPPPPAFAALAFPMLLPVFSLLVHTQSLAWGVQPRGAEHRGSEGKEC